MSDAKKLLNWGLVVMVARVIALISGGIIAWAQVPDLIEDYGADFWAYFSVLGIAISGAIVVGEDVAQAIWKLGKHLWHSPASHKDTAPTR